MTLHSSKNYWFLFCLVAILSGHCHRAEFTGSRPPLEEGFRPLFNGQDLRGWYPVVDDKGTEKDLFAVDRGRIHVYRDKESLSTQSFGGLITKATYSYYTLSFEYKWGEKKFAPRQEFVRDAGVIFHMHGEDQIWPNGVECQIQEGDTGDLWLIGTRASSKVQAVIRNYAPNGETVTRGERGQRFSRFHRAYSWEVPGWNQVKLIVKKDQAGFFVNSHLVNEALDMRYWDETAQDWRPLTSGKILLQAEGAEIFYRNIQIKEHAQ